jgi:hypothetical protein
MDFIKNIANNGCAMTCFFGNNENFSSHENINNRCGKLKIVVNENYHIPDILDTKTTLMISVLVTKFMREIIDPFNFNHETFKGEIRINSKKFDVILPPIIHHQFFVGFDNIEDNQIGSDEYNSNQNEVLNYILETLLNYDDSEIVRLFNKFKNMKTRTHIIDALRNNVRYEVGIGKIFKNQGN